MEEDILRHLAGETDDLEARRVDRWRAASEANRSRYLEIQTVWQRTDLEPMHRTRPPSVERIVREAERRRGRGRVRAVRRAPGRFRSVGYALGVAVAGVLVLFLFVDRGSTALQPPLAPVEAVTPGEETVTMALSDGSVVRVDRGSTVEVTPRTDRREVRLTGRAFFAVSQHEAPFVVHAGTGSVTVHGTRFEVREEGDGLRVVVVEGRVRVTSTSGAGVDVVAGEVARLSGDGTARVSRVDEVWALLDWTGGLLLFQETPLGEVAREVARHFDRPVTLTDPGLAERRITAWFGDERWEEVVSDICLVAGLACSVRQDGATLGRMSR